jgi:hypothetical protein
VGTDAAGGRQLAVVKNQTAPVRLDANMGIQPSLHYSEPATEVDNPKGEFL